MERFQQRLESMGLDARREVSSGDDLSVRVYYEPGLRPSLRPEPLRKNFRQWDAEFCFTMNHCHFLGTELTSERVHHTVHLVVIEPRHPQQAQKTLHTFNRELRKPYCRDLFAEFPLYVCVPDRPDNHDRTMLRGFRNFIETWFLIKRLMCRFRMPYDVGLRIVGLFWRDFFPGVASLLQSHDGLVELIELPSRMDTLMPLIRVLLDLREMDLSARHNLML